MIFILTGIVSSLASSLIYDAAFGASGAIFGVIGKLTVLRPKMTVYAFGFPMPMLTAALMWALLDLGGLFYPSNVANMGHLGGLAAGLAVGYAIRGEYKEPTTKNKRPLTEKELNDWEDKHMPTFGHISSR